MGEISFISYFLTITTFVLEIYCVFETSKSWDIEQVQRLYNSQKETPVPKIALEETRKEACSLALKKLGFAELENFQETVSSGSTVSQSNIIQRIKKRGTSQYAPTADDVQRALDFVYNVELPKLNSNISKRTTDEIQMYKQQLELKNQSFAKLKLWRAKKRVWTAKCKIFASETDDRYIIISMGKTNESRLVYFYYSIAGIREKAYFQCSENGDESWIAKHYLFVVGYVIPLEQPEEENIQIGETPSLPIPAPPNIAPNLDEKTGSSSSCSKSPPRKSTLKPENSDADNNSPSDDPILVIRRRRKSTRSPHRIKQLSLDEPSSNEILSKIPSNKSDTSKNGKAICSSDFEERTENTSNKNQSLDEPLPNETDLKFNASNNRASGKASVTDEIPKPARRRLRFSSGIRVTESSPDNNKQPRNKPATKETNFKLPSAKYLEEGSASFSRTTSKPPLPRKKYSHTSELEEEYDDLNKRENHSSKHLKRSSKELLRKDGDASNSKSELRRRKFFQSKYEEIHRSVVETPSLSEKSKTKRERM